MYTTTTNNNIAFPSQASWGRLELKSTKSPKSRFRHRICTPRKKKLPSGKGQTNGSSSTKQVKNNFRAISFKPSRVFNKPVKNISLHEVIAGEGLRSLKARKGVHFNIQISDIYWSFSSIRAYKLIFCIYSSYLTYAFLVLFIHPIEEGKETHDDWRETP